MKQLKTPEEIIREKFHWATSFTKEDVIDFIIAAQRDALECAAESAIITIDGQPATMTGVKIDKQSILNLMPKEI